MEPGLGLCSAYAETSATLRICLYVNLYWTILLVRIACDNRILNSNTFHLSCFKQIRSARLLSCPPCSTSRTSRACRFTLSERIPAPAQPTLWPFPHEVPTLNHCDPPTWYLPNLTLVRSTPLYPNAPVYGGPTPNAVNDQAHPTQPPPFTTVNAGRGVGTICRWPLVMLVYNGQ